MARQGAPPSEMGVLVLVLEEKKKLITLLFSGADEDGLLNLLVLDCFQGLAKLSFHVEIQLLLN